LENVNAETKGQDTAKITFQKQRPSDRKKMVTESIPSRTLTRKRETLDFQKEGRKPGNNPKEDLLHLGTDPTSYG